MLFKRFFAFLLIYFLTQHYALSASMCSRHLSEPSISIQSADSLVQKLDQIFVKAFFNDDVYLYRRCQENVIRLYREFLLEMPDVDLIKDFKVLYIVNRNRASLENIEEGMMVRNTRDSDSFNGEPSEYDRFNFHVVLEYRGRIYDLAYLETPTPIDKKTYAQNFFVTQEVVEKNQPYFKGAIEDLVVYEFPIHLYLNWPYGRPNQWHFHWAIYNYLFPKEVTDYFLN